MAEGNFRQCAKCGDIALMESRMSAKCLVDCRCVTLQQRRRDSLEALRVAAVTKIRCAWQKWHRSQALRRSKRASKNGFNGILLQLGAEVISAVSQGA